MGLFDWMTFSKKNQGVKVTKIADETVGIGEKVAGNQAAATETLNRMMAQKSATTKILMVQDGDYLPQVTEYALKMAQRLDCAVVALDVTAEPLQFTGDRQDRECERFKAKASESSAIFARQAEAVGVEIDHIVEIADPEKVIARLSANDAGIRYVLTKPDAENLRRDKEQAQVPVFDLNCSRIAR